MRKPDFCLCENKDADQLRGATAKLISAFVIAIRIVQFLYYQNPKFQASSHLLWLHSPVCVGPGRKPRRPFSHNEAHIEMCMQCFCFTSSFLALIPGTKLINNIGTRHGKTSRSLGKAKEKSDTVCCFQNIYAIYSDKYK